MYVILRDGTVIENAHLKGAGPGNGGMAFCIEWEAGGEWILWIDQDRIQTIRFDRDTVQDPPPEPGPDDFKIGTRHGEIDKDAILRRPPVNEL